MSSDCTDAEKYIGNMIKSFRNKQHADDVKEYLLLKRRIDKVVLT